MAARPAITVVIPALNAAQWIKTTLRTVISQTYPKDRLQIIVVDDGSSDETASVAETALNGSGIDHVVLRNVMKEGPSAARNRGWRHSRGDWIQFLDSDDLLEPLKLATQGEAARNADPDIAAFFSPWGKLVRQGDQWVPRPPWIQPAVGADPLMDVLRTENFMQLGSMLFSRIWLQMVGGFNDEFRLDRGR